MKKVVLLLFGIFLISALSGDWDPAVDGHGMHFPQLPDPTGYDVNCTLWDAASGVPVLADDWLCSLSGPITDIHFWISAYESPWPDYNFLPWHIEYIHLSIHDDIPAVPPIPYSKPGQLLWEMDFPYGTFDIAYSEPGLQGWYDPYEPFAIYPDHENYYQVNIMDIPEPFIQIEGTIYWLDISIKVLDIMQPLQFGWKTSLDHWNDNAVYYIPGADWFPLPYGDLNQPYQEFLDLAFVIGGEDKVPVELSAFNVVFNQGTSVLHWTTASESENLGWNVYKGMNNDVMNSQLINNELIPGEGTTSEPTDYTFEDETELIENETYWYWIESVELSGDTDLYGPISLTVPEEGDEPEPPAVPEIYGLHQNYPNPFNPETSISFLMSENCVGTMKIYNVKGEEVATLFKDRVIEKDVGQIENWDGKDSNGNTVPSGIYIYQLDTDHGNYSRKMILAK